MTSRSYAEAGYFRRRSTPDHELRRVPHYEEERRTSID